MAVHIKGRIGQVDIDLEVTATEEDSLLSLIGGLVNQVSVQDDQSQIGSQSVNCREDSDNSNSENNRFNNTKTLFSHSPKPELTSVDCSTDNKKDPLAIALKALEKKGPQTGSELINLLSPYCLTDRSLKRVLMMLRENEKVEVTISDDGQQRIYGIRA
ncbi:hypothetical protein [Marinibactrum halimedae]|uniref:Uncharacterized protein n=1 Tax=Marinibactrum halimedae TaxID=1444977 RepID=A0AA37T7Q2_9GAMM|nr:hypothetical protein [Marinibactrum halimedae]MCD9457923.1 hypothetical protein [Marinibactrum halimedae]GLS26252.1 hypothetical protein GCM10007877_19670 [Marinibactrum halimedae]